MNVGSGQEITIRELVTSITAVCGYRGEVRWNSTMPDGQPRTCLADGRRETVAWYKEFRHRAVAPLAA